MNDAEKEAEKNKRIAFFKQHGAEFEELYNSISVEILIKTENFLDLTNSTKFQRKDGSYPWPWECSIDQKHIDALVNLACLGLTHLFLDRNECFSGH